MNTIYLCVMSVLHSHSIYLNCLFLNIQAYSTGQCIHQVATCIHYIPVYMIHTELTILDSNCDRSSKPSKISWHWYVMKVAAHVMDILFYKSNPSIIVEAAVVLSTAVNQQFSKAETLFGMAYL